MVGIDQPRREDNEVLVMQRIEIDEQTGIIVGGINESVFTERMANFEILLQSVRNAISEHQAEIDELRRRERAITDYLADAAKINEIVSKMKIREMEGI